MQRDVFGYPVPERSAGPSEPEPDWVCPGCGQDMYGYEPLWEVDGQQVCRECFRAALDDMREEEIAMRMGLDTAHAIDLKEGRNGGD